MNSFESEQWLANSWMLRLNNNLCSHVCCVWYECVDACVRLLTQFDICTFNKSLGNVLSFSLHIYPYIFPFAWMAQRVWTTHGQLQSLWSHWRPYNILFTQNGSLVIVYHVQFIHNQLQLKHTINAFVDVVDVLLQLWIESLEIAVFCRLWTRTNTSFETSALVQRKNIYLPGKKLMDLFPHMDVKNDPNGFLQQQQKRGKKSFSPPYR